MSLALVTMALVQTSPPASGVTLECEASGRPTLSLYVPSTAGGAESGSYRLTGTDLPRQPDMVVGSLDDALSIFWRGDDRETQLDIVRYNAAAGTARYRIRHESMSSNGIMSTHSTTGVCARRRTAPLRAEND